MPFDAIPPKKKIKQKTIHAVDLFCGAGGTSTGLVNAVNDLGFEIKLTAINHWDVAIATHSKNHEDVAHFCQSIDSIDPINVVPGGRLQLLVASPECTHHSNARGGKPRSDQKRADAWLLMRWIEKLYVENILIENVKEFASWGPLTAEGKPDKRHKGKYFNQFIDALKINYNVEYRVLNCADYGDPTTRERLFIIARRNGKKILWPSRTHASRKELAKMAAQPDLFPDGKELMPWVSAREIIDWSLEGKSIFGRKKALSPNTMRRIFAGLQKYSGLPFIVPQFSGQGPRDVEEPIGALTTTSRGVGMAEPYLINLKNKDRRDRSIDDPTFTQNTGNHQAVVEPFIVSAAHGGNTNPPRDIDEPLGAVLGSPKYAVAEPFLIKNFGNADEAKYRAKSVDDPLSTVCAQRNHHGLVEAETFLLGQQSGSVAREIGEPVPTVSAKGAIAKVDVEPFIFNMAHTGKDAADRDASYCKETDEPLSTVAGKGMFGLVEADPYLVNMKGQSGSRSVDEPAFTQTVKDHQYLAEPFIVPFFGEREGQEPRTRDIDEPSPTVTTHGRIGVAEPYIVKFYGNGENANSVDEPLSTVTAKDRFGLCIPSAGVIIDIRFRMLQPHELAAAMSFPKDYEFTGNRENKVKQIGNAVPLMTAKALCSALLG